MIFTAHSAWAEGFTIRSVETNLVDKVYTVSAQIDYQFTDVAIEALQNGVPLLILIDIKVDRERNWWLDKNIAELQQGYLLLYHALTEKYLVNNLNSGAQENYDSLSSAVAALGQLDNLPLLDANLVSKDNRIIVRLHTYLDLEALPAPMRPLAYISSQWRLESDWYEWPLQP
ncbi:Probable proline rich signal peptide protein [hydrothermal vent metagenome]|uniref:Probable proline rich signal peptide protein n=1 Tax=hydrothermal vent metagenome TaxID=652676 RepID=A0A3B1A987_9ZZZZ